MSYINNLQEFLGNETFEEYRIGINKDFSPYVDVRQEDDTIIFFTTNDAVWWVRSLELRVEWPTRWEGEMEQVEAYYEMSQGKVPAYMGTWVLPRTREDNKVIERWKKQALERTNVK